MTAVMVVLGAMVGAPLRYLADRAVQAKHDSVFPWGTFTVNIAGSFILGVLIKGSAAHAVPGTVYALLGTGLCGALTTYSTFGYETVQLASGRSALLATFNAVGSVVAGLGAAGLGLAVGGAF